MTIGELQDWLVNEGIKNDIETITRLTVVNEIANLIPNGVQQVSVENIEWERLLLAGSLLARSTERSHQEAALRIATAALMLETPKQIRDAGAVLLEKLSNSRAADLDPAP